MTIDFWLELVILVLFGVGWVWCLFLISGCSGIRFDDFSGFGIVRVCFSVVL